ncbi:MAG TPA: AraC family transcriptional regulator ligand-binding domain-containing protein [Nevskia sp.]|nr:AraC family transcriptional regulator ligand-binding domain-containing protein [Nevskia sp.]
MSRPPYSAPIPFLTLPNWIKAAAHCGFNIEPIFREQGIATDLIHLESTTVVPAQLQQVMAACVARARNHHYPFVLGESFAFEYMPDIGTFLTTSSTLRDTLRVFDWVRELINPGLNVRLEVRGDEAWLILELEGGEAGPPLAAYFAETTFASIFKFGRTLLGERAQFARLCLRHAAPPYAGEYHKYFGIEIRFGQPEHALVFPRALLDVPLEGAFPALHRQAEYRVQRQLTGLPRSAASDGIVAMIERTFAERPELLGQGIERMAEALGLHHRTLQRRLQEAGQGYAGLQARARFRKAADWLQDESLSIEAISERLGFSDRRSFTRAFTRWAGMSPSAFRSKPGKVPV